MKPKAFPIGAKLRVQWQTNSNSTNGSALNVENYVTNMDLDVWQKVAIPISDFGLTADVAKLRFRFRQVAGQQFHFDEIQLVPAGAGGPFKYRVDAPANSPRHLSMMVIVISAPSANWNPTSFANIASGLTLGMLVRQRRISDSEILWRLNSKDNTDLFGRFHPQDDITFANGDLLMGFMLKPGKASVVITDDEILEILVRDDLSSLVTCRAYAHFGVETVPT
jgi:hypothetical protein